MQAGELLGCFPVVMGLNWSSTRLSAGGASSQMTDQESEVNRLIGRRMSDGLSTMQVCRKYDKAYLDS